MGEETGSALREIGELFERRFPDFACLRCGNDKFIVLANLEPAPEGRAVAGLASFGRPFIDGDTFAAGKALEDPRYTAKVVCTRCGLVEDHFLPALAVTDEDDGGSTDVA